MRRLPLVCVVAVAASAITARAQTLLHAVDGPGAGLQFGKACILIPDQNGDGVRDVLVGAPGYNAGRGAIFCVSGAYLANGIGAQFLWSFLPVDNPGDLFGDTLADVGDATGDGVSDFLVGQPGYDYPGQPDAGAVCLISGASHLIVSQIYNDIAYEELGRSMTVIGDLVGDARNEVAVGAPGGSQVFALKGSSLAQIQPLSSALFAIIAGASGSGWSSALAGVDVDGDGSSELAIGASGAGQVWIFVPLTGVYAVGSYTSPVPGDGFGSAIAASRDYDGDGIADLVVSAPKSPGANSTELGRVVVLSGARLFAHTPPYEIYTLTPVVSGSTPLSYHFGAAVFASADLDGDGVADILVGAPDFATVNPAGPDRGQVSIYSGATGARIAVINGNNYDHLGDALGGTIGDLDGDGFQEFVVAGSLSDAGGTDSGVVKCYRLFPVPPSTYCTGKLNSLGCTPAISSSGSPSASNGAPFLIKANNFLNQKNGLLFYAHAPVTTPFQGGFKCVHNPTVRTPPMSSGGAASGSSCSGTYSFDFNAWMVNGWDGSLAAGNQIFAQYWSRDPASPSHTSLSNALQFLINP